MINIISGVLYYYSSSNIFKDIISFIVCIVIFVAICAYCSKTEPSNNSSSKTTKKYNSNSYNRTSSYVPEDEYMQTNYDPTWDDAYFEKTGIEPWFDDNPWDHEKK